MTDYQFVDSVDSLPGELASQDLVGVDTEFMREKTFVAQLCLVQLSHPNTSISSTPLTAAT